jgi:hypothetical protein
MAKRERRATAAFACRVESHRGTCVLLDVISQPFTHRAEAIGSAVVLHGVFSATTLADIRACHPRRLVTVDDDVLVIWPADRTARQTERTQRR